MTAWLHMASRGWSVRSDRRYVVVEVTAPHLPLASSRSDGQWTVEARVPVQCVDEFPSRPLHLIYVRRVGLRRGQDAAFALAEEWSA